MIFRVAADLFRPGAARVADLLTLLRAAAIRGHTLWVVGDAGGVNDTESPEFERWSRALDGRLRLEIGWLRERLRRLSPHAVTRDAVVVAVGAAGPSRLPPVLRGEIQVPRFQRPGTETTWKPEQRGDLLDSIHRAYPIGTILLWSTTEDVRTLEHVGGARIPKAPDGQRVRLVLRDRPELSDSEIQRADGLRRAARLRGLGSCE